MAGCIPQNTLLRVRRLSAEIAARHGGVSPHLVAEELIVAGVAARVPIEFDLPEASDMSDCLRSDRTGRGSYSGIRNFHDSGPRGPAVASSSCAGSRPSVQRTDATQRV